jgi:GTP pyrophosphokinase
MEKISQVKDIYTLMDEHPPTEKEKELINKAYEFAKKAHEGQLRQSGDPYFLHVVETAKNLARFGMDATTISAGLLHDTIEDCGISEETVRKEFGKDILFLVNGVTKLGKVKYRGRERHVESLRKFFVAVAEDFRVLMIKLADRLHNLKTLEFVKQEKQKRIALEALEVYAPLAHRLGIAKLKGEIEDAAFPFAYPKEYAKMKEILQNKTEASLEHLEKIKKELTHELQKQNIEVIKISARKKHDYSLWKKLLKYNMEIEKIYDIAALRIIVPTVEDCYRVLGIVHSLWKPLPERIKDFIALPKLNGYQSLHTTILTNGGTVTEIQIRTPEMHGIAEYGIASHYAYKESDTNKKSQKVANKFAWIEQLHELQKAIADPTKFMENLKMDFFKDRIFVFTPKSDVIDLPEESSPIDFAYAIHSDVGDHANAVKINGKMSPLNTKLKNGDIVEIITKKDGHPSSKWLDHAKTALARKHIRQYVDENSLLNKYLFNRFK